MNMKQYKNPFDLKGFRFGVTGPKLIALVNEEHNYCSRKQIFKKEFQISENLENVEIKEEIECEMPKIDYNTGCDNDYIFRTIKQELDCKVIDISDIKQEVSEYNTKPKSEIELSSHCDLPTLKDEIIDSADYLKYPYNTKRIFKPLKTISDIISKKSRRYPCPICQKGFSSSKSRLTHIDGHFGNRFVVCRFCGKLLKKFDFVQHFYIHVVKNRTEMHINDQPLKCNFSSKVLKQKNFEIDDDKSFECNTCFKKFKLKDNLHKHLMIHEEFNQKANLRTHLKIHSGEKPFKCDICSKVFSHKSNLYLHKLIHSGEKLFKCDICSKGFSQKSGLYQHKPIHSGEKPFKCDICSKGFSQKSSLYQHKLIHSGEKLFKCDICSKEFYQKGNLWTHLKLHSGEKPFKCDICSKGFSHKSGLYQHKLIHSGEKLFKCDICSKRFSQKSGLNHHKPIHSVEKLFKCDICSKRFSQKSGLNHHKLIHNGEKLFKILVYTKLKLTGNAVYITV